MRIITLLLVITLIMACGCNRAKQLHIDQKNRLKSIKKTKFRAADSPSIAISGHVITCQELLNTPILENEKLVPLSKILKPLAQTNDLENFKIKAKFHFEQALNYKIAYIITYEMAKKKAEDDSEKDVSEHFDDAIEQQIENYIRDFVIDNYDGDYAKAQKELEEQGSDWQSLRESQRRLILISTQLPHIRPVIYQELLETYEILKDDFFTQPPSIQIRLIDIALYTPYPTKEKHDQARNLAQKLATQLSNDANFANLAKEHSDGHMKEFGGLWKPANPESFEKPYDILAEHAEKMIPGQISGPIEAVPPTNIFIMKLEEKNSWKVTPLREVQQQIEELLINRRRDQAAIDLDRKIETKAEIAKTDKFIELSLETIYKKYSIKPPSPKILGK